MGFGAEFIAWQTARPSLWLLQVPPLLKTLTSNFDDFSALPPDDPRHAAPGGGAGAYLPPNNRSLISRLHEPRPLYNDKRPRSPVSAGDGSGTGLGLGTTTRGSRKARAKFVGYTFKRAPDGRTYLPAGASGAGGGGGTSGGAPPPGTGGSGVM